MFADSLSMGFGLFGLIYFIVGIAIYAALVRQIRRRQSGGVVPVTTFGLVEATIAFGLIILFVLNVFAGLQGQPAPLNDHILLQNLLFTVAVVLLIVLVLFIRGVDITSLGGFGRISFLRVLSTAIVLLLAAGPLISMAESITETLLGGRSTRQSIVELFSSSSSIDQRILIIFFAVAIAPAAEEFLFRFFIYGVLRRYFGWVAGTVFNALLFAAVHTHLPSFGPLFVLALCLTIAYESSGSILVSMTMHALFNAASLTLLAFPEIVPQ
jgi:membrane protease YdiL (CAAX protease family)